MNGFIEVLFRGVRRLDWFISKSVLRKKVIRRHLPDFDIYLDLITPGISRTLAIYRSREEDMIYIIKKVLKPGMKVIDCGSNIGFYPLLEANILKGDGSIYAIEPDLRNFVLLNKNIEASEYGNSIKPFQLAISNKVGKEKMFVAQESNLNKIVSEEDDFADRHIVDEIVEVETTTLDMFCSNDEYIDFVRMDIEGFEVEVFQGMKKIFANAKKGFMVFIELHPHAYTPQRDFSIEIGKILELDFIAKYIVSAGEACPQKFTELGYAPSFTIKTDGMVRGVFEGVKNEDVVSLTCFKPKLSRYVLFEKM